MTEDETSLTNPANALASSSRSWRCLREDVVAAYLDGVMDEGSRRRAESHLVDCEACRSLVGDLVTMQRLEWPPLPLGLKQRAMATVGSPASKRRFLVPGLLSAGLVCAVAIFLMVDPQNIRLPLAKTTPVAPEIAKSEQPPMTGNAISNMMRALAPSNAEPEIVFPVEDLVLRREEIIFHWKKLHSAQRYEIHLVTSEGDPVWESESKTTALGIPWNVKLKEGAYFVWIGAVLNDGRVEKSPPVRFLVKTTQ